MLKFCKRGQHEVDILLFHKNSKSSDGLQDWCKSCRSEYDKLIRKSRTPLEIQVPDFKLCKKCGINKPRTDFNNSQWDKSGLQVWCRECQSFYGKQEKTSPFDGAYPVDKTCFRCKITKSFTQFHKDKWSRDGLTSYCNTCATERNRFSSYGVTPEEMQTMKDNQSGECAWCGTHESELSRGLMLDHDHATGRVRRLLCHNCNVIEGLIKNRWPAGLIALEKIAKYPDPEL